ncbi:hypothetical protein FB567DRAFT_61712 [Paraphoma chrysanthemicola]|uniref:Uncharacterized protein n=1 Tax=Paraphoma chrysanthemicola TaxID=798071 RepID=A0A8K0VY81_9PLEO|nr:hypothetical protein FB567DRAFT_61712 [Paraphoma chrysanthemicola]
MFLRGPTVACMNIFAIIKTISFVLFHFFQWRIHYVVQCGLRQDFDSKRRSVETLCSLPCKKQRHATKVAFGGAFAPSKTSTYLVNYHMQRDEYARTSDEGCNRRHEIDVQQVTSPGSIRMGIVSATFCHRSPIGPKATFHATKWGCDLDYLDVLLFLAFPLQAPPSHATRGKAVSEAAPPIGGVRCRSTMTRQAAAWSALGYSAERGEDRGRQGSGLHVMRMVDGFG